MRRFISLILIMLISAAAVQARTLTPAEIKTAVSKQVVQDYKKYTDAQVEVNVIAIPFANIEIPEGKLNYSITSQQDKFLPRDLKRVVLYVNGKAIRNFNVPVQVKAYKNVLVAATFIERGKSITPTVVVSKKMEVSDRLEYSLTSESLSKEIITRKFFKEGEVIDMRFVTLRPDVCRNSSVQAFFKSNGLLISVDAIALGDGMVGDYVTIENRNYKRTYTGKIIGENKVLINI